MAKKSANVLPPVAVVWSRYNESVTAKLRDGALRAYRERGGDTANVGVFECPGSFELPGLAQVAAMTDRFAGVVALGCLIKGETKHDQYIAAAVADGLSRVSLSTGVPTAFGVLTVDTPKQAKARAGGKKGNKGAEAMHAVLDAAAAILAIEAWSPGITAAKGSHDKPDKAEPQERGHESKTTAKKSGKKSGKKAGKKPGSGEDSMDHEQAKGR